MARRSNNAEAEWIARALRVRRGSKWAAVFLGIVLALSAYLSHRSAPPPAKELEGQTVDVVRVIDGDTIVIRTTAGQQEHVRLRGIDAPELANEDRPAHFWGPEATDYLKKRIDRQRVILQIDGTEPRDRYGRLLAFVYQPEHTCVNLDLVRDGQAYADRRFTSFMRSQLEQAETEARKRERGLWKQVKPEQMPEWRQRWSERRDNREPASELK
jgi:endonuclease YncB( thermonuclease family)